jgi:lysozyme family protein
VSEAFDRAFEWTIVQEGGKVDDPDDSGGPTRWGISRKSYPSVDLDKLTIADAKQIYYRDYWMKVRGEALPWPLSLVLFDWAVHSGQVTAIMALQRILGCYIDGKFGPQTKASALAANQAVLVQELIEDRLESMILQAIANPAKVKYLSNGKRAGGGGWVGRIVALAMDSGKAL